ncbi:hypothetical protein Bbelb_270860 [Branchiostoma belcheri]|nr:hypothetical protein Bbelb_270860 [Branchiostoma belcheri]
MLEDHLLGNNAVCAWPPLMFLEGPSYRSESFELHKILRAWYAGKPHAQNAAKPTLSTAKPTLKQRRLQRYTAKPTPVFEFLSRPPERPRIRYRYRSGPGPDPLDLEEPNRNAPAKFGQCDRALSVPLTARKTLATALAKFVQRLIAVRATLAKQRWSSVQDFCVGLADPNVSNHQNHGPEDEQVEARSITSRMLQAVENDPSRPVRRVYDAVLQEEEEPDAAPSFNTVRTQLQRRRDAFVPAIPSEVEDVVIEDHWRETWDGHQYLSHQDNDWGILIFCTNRNFRKLEQCDVLYVDGTFKSCPRPYSQFVTIHGLYQGRVLPFVMALMADKTVGAYRQVLRHVRGKVRDLTGHRLRPERVVVDFEVSLISAIEIELPHAAISGCYFHFCQSMWRRIQHLGLAGRYREDDRLRKFLRKLMAIGYLPVALVRLNFFQLLRSRSTQRLVAQHPALRDFFRYMRDNYVNPDGSFPVAWWNVFERNNDTRTNNHVEGFHQRWNSTIGRAHPSLWLFLRKMKDEEKLTKVKIAGADRGDPPPPGRESGET